MTSKTIYGCAPIQSSIDNRFHYVYRITHLVEGKHYYGVRSSKVNPFDDLGTSYFGTPSGNTNKWIKKDQKHNREHYKYKVVCCFQTREAALSREILLHRKFDVKTHKKFYNEANQTQIGFSYSASGMRTMRNINTGVIKNYPVEYESSELVHVAVGANIGYVTVKDSLGRTSRVSVNDTMYLSGELVSINIDMVNVKDKDGNGSRVSKNDPMYISGELKHAFCGVNIGFVVCRHKKSGEIKRLEKTSIEYLSGEYEPHAAGMITSKTENGFESLTREEFDAGNYSGASIGMMTATLKQQGEKVYISTEEFHSNKNLYKFHTAGTVQVKTQSGETIRVSKEDSRYLSGELKSNMIGTTRQLEQRSKQGSTQRANDWRWISNSIEQKQIRVKFVDLQRHLELGWVLGKKF